jgi:hypothetical protein
MTSAVARPSSSPAAPLRGPAEPDRASFQSPAAAQPGSRQFKLSEQQPGHRGSCMKWLWWCSPPLEHRSRRSKAPPTEARSPRRASFLLSPHDLRSRAKPRSNSFGGLVFLGARSCRPTPKGPAVTNERYSSLRPSTPTQLRTVRLSCALDQQLELPWDEINVLQG